MRKLNLNLFPLNAWFAFDDALLWFEAVPEHSEQIQIQKSDVEISTVYIINVIIVKPSSSAGPVSSRSLDSTFMEHEAMTACKGQIPSLACIQSIESL